MNHRTHMTYDPGEDRWMVELCGAKYSLHCGEVFGLFITQEYIPCRLEWDGNWYIIAPGARFYLRDRETYMVEI